MASQRLKKKPPRPVYSAKSFDKHRLYQLSVQDPEVEVKFLDRVYRGVRGKSPLSLREDFCGTALLAATWVKSRRDRRAVGLDLDAGVLAWGDKHNLAPLGDARQRVQLLRKDVRDGAPGRHDVCVALNFSYWCFRDRATLKSYFRSVRKGLAKDGMLFLDAYGGYMSHEPDLEEARSVDGKFTYVWHQKEVDAITSRVLNHIHFKFKDGTQSRRAFTYQWRMWSLAELRELLTEAGYSRVTVYWEDGDAKGRGTGVFRPKKVIENEAAWVAYLAAEA